MKIYLASPFFNTMQVAKEQVLKEHLKELGHEVFAPKDETFIPPNATHVDRLKAFDDNCHAIKDAHMVVAITDGKDVGTIWECGYAFAKKVPIIYVCTELKGNPFNLMLAESGIGVIETLNPSFKKQFKILTDKFIATGESTLFKGEIE